MQSTVVYDASQGYDEDTWDDSALIKAYDRAKESSRELQRVRKEGGRRKRDWGLGEACRATYSVDGEEYEGTVVNKNVGNKSVTVRFHGYNNEEEVRLSELMESLGPEAVEEQVEQARLDEEYEEGEEEDEEEEEEGAGDEFRVGDWCRAEWSEDGVVYEAVIESINRKKGKAKVRFIGFNNMEEKELDELFLSKGEERRKEQESRGAGGIREDEIHDLIAKNCPDLLANFGEQGGAVDNLDLGKLSMESKVKKPKQKESSIGRSLHGALTSEFSEDQVKTEIIGVEESISSKGSKKKEKKQEKERKVKKEKKTKPDFTPDLPLPPFPNQAFMSQQQPMGMPSPWSMPQGMGYGVPQSPMSSMFPSMPSTPMSFQSPLMQNMPPPPPMLEGMPPPPPMLEGMESMDPSLHSLLLSWYMAGYQAGRYQTSQAKAPTKVKAKSKSPLKS